MFDIRRLKIFVASSKRFGDLWGLAFYFTLSKSDPFSIDLLTIPNLMLTYTMIKHIIKLNIKLQYSNSFSNIFPFRSHCICKRLYSLQIATW